MKITFITNACAIFEYDGLRILSDPWFTEGAFEGSWVHDPPLKTALSSVLDVDAIYISHAHPDHYDPAALSHFRKDIPLIVRYVPPLPLLLRKSGFLNVLAVKDYCNLDIGPFRLTMYPGNPSPLLDFDSTLVMETRDTLVINANDNPPSLDMARTLRQKHGHPCLVMMSSSSAGPYPACFKMAEDAKLAAAELSFAKRCRHAIEVFNILEPRRVMPFAGAYRLQGRLADKNPYLGAFSHDQIASRWKDYGAPEVVCLHEGESFTVEAAHYSYEVDPMPDVEYLRTQLCAGMVRVMEAAKANRYSPTVSVGIVIGDSVAWMFTPSALPALGNYLKCTLDPRLLLRILEGRASWNHAEIGCHIEFERNPDVHIPEVHWLLEYLRS